MMQLNNINDCISSGKWMEMGSNHFFISLHRIWLDWFFISHIKESSKESLKESPPATFKNITSENLDLDPKESPATQGNVIKYYSEKNRERIGVAKNHLMLIICSGYLWFFSLPTSWCWAIISISESASSCAQKSSFQRLDSTDNREKLLLPASRNQNGRKKWVRYQFLSWFWIGGWLADVVTLCEQRNKLCSEENQKCRRCW